MLNLYIPYNIVLSDNKIYSFRDIFSFRNVFSQLFANSDYSYRYTIKDSDTPRSIAYTLYGSEKYEWIIYLLNNITDPYNDWPLSEESFYEMISEKYLQKQCIFVKLDSFTNNFVVGETITQNNSTAIIESWDRTLCKITVKNVVGSFTNNTQITSNSSTATVARVVQYAEDAVHHFEYSNGIYLDPLLGFLQSYLLQTSELYAITNKQYELRLNDEKRKIFVLKPSFIKSVEAYLLRNVSELIEVEASNIIQ